MGDMRYRVWGMGKSKGARLRDGLFFLATKDKVPPRGDLGGKFPLRGREYREPRKKLLLSRLDRPPNPPKGGPISGRKSLPASDTGIFFPAPQIPYRKVN